MSKAFAYRLTAALAVLITASAVGASSASAAPPIGTNYCMDGTFTFATWDAASQHVADKVVNQYAGLFTAGENDPANASLPALQQFYDALETSNATGNYGIDTTIPNYIIHTISLGACPIPPENNVFLCYSKFEVDPGVWPVTEAEGLMDDGYWSPAAADGNIDGGTNIGGYHLVCNPPAATARLALDPTATLFIGGSGETVGSAVDGLPGYYPYLG